MQFLPTFSKLWNKFKHFRLFFELQTTFCCFFNCFRQKVCTARKRRFSWRFCDKFLFFLQTLSRRRANLKTKGTCKLIDLRGKLNLNTANYFSCSFLTFIFAVGKDSDYPALNRVDIFCGHKNLSNQFVFRTCSLEALNNHLHP